MKKNRKILISIILMTILCLSQIMPVMATSTDAQNKTVRVATNINNSLYLNDKGEPEGYCSEYLIELAKINHWNLEYVEASWNDSVQNLYDGKIDLLFPTQMTDERKKTMGFSTAIGGYQPIGLFARADSKFCYDDYDAFNGAKIALSAGTSNEAALQAYAKENGFTYEAVYLNTAEEKETALSNGDVDMIVFSTLNDVKDGKVVSMLGYLPFYYCTNIENTELLKELNYGMDQMLIRHPDMVQDVFDSFMNRNISFAYTTEEQKEILNHGKIVIGVYEDTEPLFSVGKDGNYRGIYVDLIKRIGEISGLNFEIRPLKRNEIAFDYLEQGVIDFVMGSSDQAPNKTEKNVYVYSEGVMDYYTINITRSDYDIEKSDKSVYALTNGRRFWTSSILKKDPNVTFEYYLSSKDCLNAVQSGKADVTLLNSWEFNYQSKNHKYEDLIEWENTRALSQSVFISLEGVDAKISSVLDKSIEQISNAEKEKIITANLNRPYDSADFSDRLYEAKDTLLIFGFMFITVIGGLSMYIILRRKSMKALEEKNQQLQESNEAKDLFLSRMSHELRTPLNAIGGYAAVMDQNILEHKYDEKNAHTFMESIQRAVKYQLAIIGDLLDIQRIESGKIELAPLEVDSTDYINNVLAMITPEAREKGIQFSYERLNSVNETYFVDAVRLEQVLLNLLHNAVKFTPVGGKVKMTTEIIDQGETTNTLKFVISDTGIGMSEDFKEHYLFHKFAQEYKGNTSPYEGCGTGLAISKELIHLMGGEITCESTQGVGSTFTVILTAKHIDKKKKRGENKARPTYDLSGIRILLCEDNEMNQDMERRLLERMHCKVDIAADGQVGVDLFNESQEGTYDMILMDIRMPNMDGFEATRRMRALDRDDAKTVPILAVSANSFEEDVKNSLEAGMNEHLAKPIDATILYEKINQYCNVEQHTK